MPSKTLPPHTFAIFSPFNLIAPLGHLHLSLSPDLLSNHHSNSPIVLSPSPLLGYGTNSRNPSAPWTFRQILALNLLQPLLSLSTPCSRHSFSLNATRLTFHLSAVAQNLLSYLHSFLSFPFLLLRNFDLRTPRTKILTTDCTSTQRARINHQSVVGFPCRAI